MLQHLEESQQITAKQRVLTDNLRRIGHVEPGTVLPPLTDAAWGYRRKGRFSVRYVEKKGKVVVGFRETNPRFVADLSVCHTVVPSIGLRIPEISALVESLDGRRTLPQIEFIAGDEAVALVFRHLEPLSEADLARLLAFAKETGFAVFLQPGGVDTVKALWPEQVPLSFAIPGYGLSLDFRPLDFIQVNAGLNDKMIASALDLLDPQPGDRVLDLFCGLGNFTLPLAKRAGQVVGVEGDAGLVARARDNAARNGLGNVQFHAADLFKDLSDAPWMQAGFDKLLLDPPRAGAEAQCAELARSQVKKIVAISCNPLTLARDLSILIAGGYRVDKVTPIDQFLWSPHVEAVATLSKG